MLPSTKRARHARCTYVPRHARPSHLPAKVAAASAFGGVLIPTAAASPAYAAEQQASTVRVSGPGQAVQPGAAPVSVRLLSDGRYVANGTVELQIREGSGWRTVARTNTGSDGLGRATVSVSRDTPVRAHYRGSATRSAATSSSVTIDVESFGQRVVEEAARHQGAPYRYGATGPNAFDCSGFTRYVFAKFGKSLPHNADAQRNTTQAVSRSDIRVGDLVFLDDAGHVGIYAGNGSMWDSPRAGKTVSLRKIYSTTYRVGRVASA